MKHIKTLLLLLLTAATMTAAPRWDIAGHHSVQWNNLRGGVPHSDHVEMAGEQVAVVYHWNVDESHAFHVNRHLVFSMLRTIPNDTHASWYPQEDIDFLKGMTVNKQQLHMENVKQVTLDGKLSTLSHLGNQLELRRILYPCTTAPAIAEQYTLKNISDRALTLRIPAVRQERTTNAQDGTRGSYRLVSQTSFQEALLVKLQPGQETTFHATIQGYAINGEKELKLNASEELTKRQAFIDEVTQKLDFHCPNDTLNTLFALSKIRGSESIFRTQNGLMHCPGGETFYAAIWCNDQAEYMNPFCPFLGYGKGNEQAQNCWRLYKKYMNPEYNFVPWSIICGGDDVFGRFDRGDAAMLAYGASRYCLELGDAAVSAEVWPLIEWCLEYCHRKLNAEGVVASDADELEGRLPAGKANLCTSSLYYDALLSAAYLSQELGHKAQQAATYRRQAQELRQHMDSYFHATVEGYDTYRYYEGNDQLRSWICIPLTMGIYERAKGTIEAMFSPRLWTENGMLSISGDNIFWDRSTLYGLRGTFAAGYPDRALEFMQKFSAIRLLGEHVPYVVEAWPEGGQRHLSAENALYCRIITEGLLGFRPTGHRTFTLTPQMPTGWNEYSLRNIYACSAQPYDIHVERKGQKLRISISRQGKTVKTLSCSAGKSVSVKM